MTYAISQNILAGLGPAVREKTKQTGAWMPGTRPGMMPE
jgi:hypothetical protein